MNGPAASPPPSNKPSKKQARLAAKQRSKSDLEEVMQLMEGCRAKLATLRSQDYATCQIIEQSKEIIVKAAIKLASVKERI